MSARGALALTLANVAAGVLNYLFQVRAAIALDATAFGAFSGWLAQITLIGSIACVVQFLSLDFRLTRFDALVRPVGIAAVGAVGVQVVVGGALDRVVLGALTVAGGILLYAIVGQLQGRVRLADVGAAVFVAAGARLGLSFLTTFYAAQAASAFAGVGAVGLLAFRREPERPTPPRDAGARFGVRLSRSVLLAFATVVFPQLDVLLLSLRVDATTLGLFSRYALAARIVFFAGGAVLPVLLSHQLRQAEDDTAPPAFVVFAQRWLPPAVLVGALVLAIVADAAVFRVRSAHATWLYLSCASAALLVSILAQVQRLAARAEITRAGASVAGILLASGVAAAASGGVVERYVLVACAGNALVLAVSTVLASRPCRS
jgi:hypothetical protein